MDVNRHIILSLVLHVMFVTAVFILVGRDTLLRVSPIINVYLIQEAVHFPSRQETGKKTSRSGSVKKPETPSTIMHSKTFSAFEEAKVIPPVVNRILSPQEEKKKSLGGGDSGTVPGRFSGNDLRPGQPKVDGAAGLSDSLVSEQDGATISGHTQEDMAERSSQTHALRIIREAIEKAKSYPFVAKKRGMEGTAIVEFSIGRAGLPEHIRISRSSGYDVLDAAACKTISSAAPFPPVQGTIEVPISFRLK